MKYTLFVALAAFGLGYLVGQAGLPVRLPADGTLMDTVAPARMTSPGGAGLAVEPVASQDSAADGPRNCALPDQALPDPAGLAAYERLLRDGPDAEAAALRERLVDQIRACARDGRVADALTVLRSLVVADPRDASLRLVESELLQQQGRLVDAIEPLLVVLGQTGDPATSGAAREQLRLLVNVQETQLANRRDLGGLIRFFEDLVARDPGFDGHRLRLARWLLQSGRVPEAERVALEMGDVGVGDDERDDLFREIGFAREGLPVERDERGLHVRATIAGRPARLLVDTGAGTTVVSAAFARGVGSVPIDSRVEVRTAGGVVTGALHRVRDVQVGGVRLPELEVLVLEHVPADADGLLGMDVLGRLPAGILPGSLLGRPPASG